MPEESSWSIQLFGGLRVSGPGTTIDRFPTRRSALLLARIALSRSGSVGRDDLASALWPDDYLDATRLRLRQELNRLRETLGPAAELIDSDRSWIRLNFDKAVVDTRQFEHLLNSSRLEENPEQRSKRRTDALTIYLGPLLPEQTEDWVLAERQDFHSKYLAALIEQTEQQLADGDLQEALASALKAVRSDPYHEPARLVAMTAFAAIGDYGGALRQYSEYEKALQREFAIRPSEAMQRFVGELGKRSSAEVQAPSIAKPTGQELSSERRASVPVYLERIVGREKELELLQSWFTADPPTRLAVLTGPGGVGKTRVAIAAAGQCQESFNGEVVYVALADLEPGQPVAGKIQEAFGLKGTTGYSEPLPHWGGRPCLLVLDNAEHVLDDARRAVKDVLLSHAGACLLVTSRLKLGIGGEQELPLTPLPVPEITADEGSVEHSPASQLFLDRARAVLPGYAVPTDQREAFIMLLERLDGLPLAIELAAARTAFMSPEQMLAEIDDRFTFLVSRRSDVESRQRSLRATIDWSFRGLSSELKEMLAVIAVFRGGCTLDFVRQAITRGDTIDVLQDLVEHSLIQREDSELGIRFTMLDSIRDYVLSEFPAERLQEIRARHASIVFDYLFDKSRGLRGADKEKYLAIRLELDNARAALDWALEHDRTIAVKAGASLWRFWNARGRPQEGASYLDKMLAFEEEVPSEIWPEINIGRGSLALLLAKPLRAVECLKRAAALYESQGKPESWASMNLTFALIELGRCAEAAELIDRVLAAHGADGYCLNAKARALPRLGRYEEAMAAAEQMFAMWVSLKDSYHGGRAHYMMGVTYAECGRLDGVLSLLTQGADELRLSGIQNIFVRALLYLAIEQLRLDDLESYRRTAAEAWELAVTLGDATVLCELIALEARCFAKGGDLAASARKYETALLTCGETECLIDAIAIGSMAAHDLAGLERLEAAKAMLEGVEGLLAPGGCGLTWLEKQEVEATLQLTGPVKPSPTVRTGKDLAGSVLPLLAEIR